MREGDILLMSKVAVEVMRERGKKRNKETKMNVAKLAKEADK